MKAKQKERVYLENLGCARNLVDSENMLGRLVANGYHVSNNPEQASVIIVNTCGFIEAAINESIDTVLSLANYKKNGSCHKLIITGCLPERFREEIADALPEVDFFLGTGAFGKIVDAIRGLSSSSRCLLPDPDRIIPQGPDDPRQLSSFISVYLKIAEGCNRKCTYCIIPALRGKQKSRQPEDIIKEAQNLVSKGIKELVLIAQDTTSYGKDLSGNKNLSQLLEMLSGISDDLWIRFLYGHPESIDDSIVKTVANHPNICPYFDLPVQHVSDPVLKRMGRGYRQKDLYHLFKRIRTEVPNAAIRTTMMVGFPGETEEDFENLLQFVKDIRFEHLGVFIYSDYNDLPSHKLAGHVPEKIARERFDRLMICQSDVSLKNNQKHVGRTYEVLVEEQSEENLFTGRTHFQAPEVDGVTYIYATKSLVGKKVRTKITDAYEYDLSGEVE